jgi:hypothetical protein
VEETKLHLLHNPKLTDHYLKILSITTTYYPLCRGDGTFPPLYQKVERGVEDQLNLIMRLAQEELLSLLFEQSKLLKEMEKQKELSRYTTYVKQEKFYMMMIKLVTDTLQIISSFGISISLERMQQILKEKADSGYYRLDRLDTRWDEIFRNAQLTEARQYKVLADLSRQQRERGEKPVIHDCGLILATTPSGQLLGSIWVFYDPCMVSSITGIRYIFAEGIRGSWPYLLARQIVPTLPKVSSVLIPCVLEWARSKNVKAIRINPLPKMHSILTKYYGFIPLTMEQAQLISPYIEDIRLSFSATPVIKYI